LKSKRRILIYLTFFFILQLISIFFVNRINKNQIKKKFEEITVAEGMTIGHLLELSGLHLADDSNTKLTAFLDRLYKNEEIVYIGLFNGEELNYLLSRYEGFFPVIPGQEGHRILDTPMGKILEISSRFHSGTGKMNRLYIGFNYDFLTAFETATSRNFLLVVGLFSLTMLIILVLVFYFDKKFYGKELELEREKQEKERLKEFSLLTSEIAHEIKNPLNSIYLSFNTLEKYCTDDEDALFYRDAIKGEIKRITGILNSYSDLSKEIRPQWQDLDIHDLAEGFHFLMKEELQSKNAQLQIEVSDQNKFKSDENLLKQILLNLVKNALEAGATDISAKFDIQKGSMSLNLTDNGSGIAMPMQKSIFKPYISTKTKGMGLGLHITRRLVEALQGDIRLIHSKSGNTCFQVTLPSL
jgi:signal transduction histidine kinase